MSLTSPIPDDQGVAHTAVGAECFLCGAPLSDPAVFWMGATGEIYLHPNCTTELAIALFADLSRLKAEKKRARS